MQRSLFLFENAIKSEFTRNSYLYKLNKFLEWAKISDTDSLLERKDSELRIMLEDYLVYQKKRISPNSIPAIFAPLELFFTMNDRNLDFKKNLKEFCSHPLSFCQCLVNYVKMKIFRSKIAIVSKTLKKRILDEKTRIMI